MIALGSDAVLVASDAPFPLDHGQDWRTRDGAHVCLAQASGRVPAFWLFCFSRDSIVEVHIPAYTRVGLVSGMVVMPGRLAERDSATPRIKRTRTGIRIDIII